MKKMLLVDLNPVPEGRIFNRYEITWALDGDYARQVAAASDFDCIFCSFQNPSYFAAGFVEWMRHVQPTATIFAEMPRNALYNTTEKQMQKSGTIAIPKGSLGERYPDVELLAIAAAERTRIRPWGRLK